MVDIFLREGDGCPYACSSCADDDDIVDCLQLAGDECGKEEESEGELSEARHKL